MGFIYKITSPSKKMYVGQTKKKVPQKRWKEHCQPSYKGCNALKSAIQKYGAENMTFETIEECSNNLLNDREEHWIRELDTLAPKGYNLRSGGGANEMCEESRAKLSKTQQQNSIDKKGYVGSIRTHRGYISAVAPDGCTNLGSYATREEAEGALRVYTRDPENFVPKLSNRKHGTGAVCKLRTRWSARIAQNKQNKNLGLYDTKEEAENACARYLKDPRGFVMPPTLKRRDGTGSVYKREIGNRTRWKVMYTGKYLGTFATEAQAETAILAHKEKIEGKKPLKE